MSVLSRARANTPFKHAAEVHQELKADLGKIVENNVLIGNTEIEKRLDVLCDWLRTTPRNTTMRIHDSSSTPESARHLILKITQRDRKEFPNVSLHADISELITVHSWDQWICLDLEKRREEVIVDTVCGSAVLRGAHVFAPGVIGIPRGLVIDDKVSVYADVTGRCKKGLVKKYEDDSKIFLGNGLVKQTRKSLFGSDAKVVSGIAIYMTDVVSRIPQINIDASLRGKVLLQNLPSIICVRILDPQRGETVLDMCAAPGNKTTHISFLMRHQGTLIALEKNKSKIEQLTRNCKEFDATNVKIFCFDSTKAVSDKNHGFTNEGPPFPEQTFDRILLDGPCSALGQRPQLLNTITAVQLRSYVPLQRKLFSAAVRLLKENGILVYSTCTVTIAENEAIVAWALKTFPCLILKPVEDQFPIGKHGSVGYQVDGLTREQADGLRRFGPEGDTVGFFIACFTKISASNGNK